MSTAEKSPRLSLVVLAREHGNTLQDTLNGVAELADEIVVARIEPGSANPSLVKQYGARLLDCSGLSDASAARNACLTQVQSPWILWLHAGERLAPNDQANFRDIVARDDRQVAHRLILQIPGRSTFDSAEQVSRIRLMPRHSGIRFAGRVRETAEDSLNSVGIRVQPQSITIHRGFQVHDAASIQQRARRNARLATQEMREQGPTARLLNCLGESYWTLQDRQQALRTFRYAVAASEPKSIAMLEAYYGLIATDVEDMESQTKTCLEAIKHFPTDIQLLVALGGLLNARGQAKMAVNAYQVAYRHGQVNSQLWHLTETVDLVAISYSWVLQREERFAEARAVLEQAVEMNPSSLRLSRQLIDFYVKQGSEVAALDQVDRLPVARDDRSSFRNAVRGALLGAHRNWSAARIQLEKALSSGCRDPFCYRWLTKAQLATGAVGRARATLNDWLAIDPFHPDAIRFRNRLDSSTGRRSSDERFLRVDHPHSTSGPSRVRAAKRAFWPGIL